jgi:DNA primase
MAKLRYSEFCDNIDVEALEAAIGFEVLYQTKGNDMGYCFDFWGLHKNGDTTGKLGIHRDKKVWNCWLCGGGSLLDLAMHLNDMDVDDATYWLYQFAHGDQKDDAEWTSYLLDMLKDVEVRTSTMPYFNERVLERFNGPRDYFYERGISDEVIEAHRLGTNMMYQKNSPYKTVGNEKVKLDDDYVGPVAVFPHFWNGNLVGWQHRWIDWPDTPKWLGKWTNTTDFPKNETIYNYENALKSGGPVFVAESNASVLFLETCQLVGVSTFGSDVSESQLRLLRRLQQGVILCPDNDEVGGAGRKWQGKIATYLQRYIPVWYVPPVPLGQGADLGDFAKTDNPYENLITHVDRALPYIEFELDLNT